MVVAVSQMLRLIINTLRHVAAVFPENATNLDSIKFMDGVETGYAFFYNYASNWRLS